MLGFSLMLAVYDVEIIFEVVVCMSLMVDVASCSLLCCCILLRDHVDATSFCSTAAAI